MNPKDPGVEEDFDLEEEGADPFEDFEEGPEEEAGSDPFDFSEGPSEQDPGSSETKIKSKTDLASRAQPVASASTSMKTQAAGLTNDLPVQLVAVMGKKNITVGELLALKKGEIVELNRFPNEAVDLVANGRLMAKGELVEVDGKLGIRIIKIYS